MTDPSPTWDGLPEALQQQTDSLLRDRQTLRAIVLVRAATGIGLHDAQWLVENRRAIVAPDPPLPTVEDILAAFRERIASSTPRRVRASWDGDTHGWGVELIAEFAGGVELRVTFLRAPAGDARLFSGTVPSWPEAELASRIGRMITKEFGIDFVFDSPDGPPR